jgi:hypothetical protein
MPIKKMVVVRKSGEKDKISKKGRPYKVRYVTCQDFDDPTTGYSLAIYPDRNGEYPDVFTYSVIEVPMRSYHGAAVNASWDLNIDGSPFDHIGWVNGFKQHEIINVGRYATHMMVIVDLDNVRFHHSYLADEHTGVMIRAETLGFEYFPQSLNKVELEGQIRIFGEFEHRLRSVYNKESRSRDWFTAYSYKEGSFDKSRSDLALLEQIVTGEISNDRLRDIIRKIKEVMREGRFVPTNAVRDMLKEAGITNQNPDELLESVALRKDYEPAFFRALKEIHNEGDQIFYSDTGFIFHVEDAWVWEEPKYGSATYLFERGASSVDALAVTLETVSKTQILKNEEMQDLTGFIRRVIHPKDADDDKLFNRWLLEVQQKI